MNGRQLNSSAVGENPASWMLRGAARHVRPLEPAPGGAHAAGSVRPLEARDVEGVARLYEQVMPAMNDTPPEVLRARLSRLLLSHPWSDGAVTSLVFEESSGEVAGCLGVMPRPMVFRGRPVTAAVSHSFIVTPGARSSLAAMELIRTFLGGSQDLSLAEGGDISRKIWERAGGCTAQSYGLCWTRPLQPSRYVLSAVSRRGLSTWCKRVLHPLCRLVDALAPAAGGMFRFPPPPLDGLELDAQTLAESLTEVAGDRSLTPCYDEYSCRWLLETLEQKRYSGILHRVAVRNEWNEVVGWYLYYGGPGKIGAVVQIGAKPGYASRVVDHLFHHARHRGMIAVSGQADPSLFNVLAGKDCLFHHDGRSWMLVHAKHPELLQTIHLGGAFLSRLDGEWWISFLLS